MTAPPKHCPSPRECLTNAKNSYDGFMKPLLFAVITCLCACGCKPQIASKAPSDKAATSANVTQAAAVGSPQAAGGAGDSGTVAPIGPNIGPMTPVSGGENLGSGTGGGVAQMAKQQAKKAAGQAEAPAGTGDSETP